MKTLSMNYKSAIQEESIDLIEWVEISRRVGNGPWIGGQPTPQGNKLCFFLRADSECVFARLRVTFDPLNPE